MKKTPYRKQRYTEYLTNIMPQAHSYKYIELIMKKSKVRSFIEQISHEQQYIKIKNSKFSIWKKNWETIFIHLEDIITN